MKPYSVCMIGNSHVAALKLAWSDRAPKLSEGFTMTFFSAQNRLMNHIEAKGRALVSGSEELAEKLRYTSDGMDRIELETFDAFVLVGSGFGIDVLRLREECGTIAPGGGPDGGNVPLLSRACFEAVVETYLDRCTAMELADMIRKVTPAPILLVGAPFVSERMVEDEPFSAQPWLKDRAFLEDFVACCRAAATRVAKRRGCEIVWQAPETVAMPGFTREAFNKNPVRFKMRSTGQPEFDAKHGNEDYGALMLTAILERLDAFSGGRVLAATSA